jgi:heat shock protein HtpX
VATTLAGAVMVAASLLRWELLFGSSHREETGRGPLGTLALIMLAPIAAMLIQLGISRAREYQADAAGAKITRAPLGLASALRKLARLNAGSPLAVEPSMAHLFIVNPLAPARLRSSSRRIPRSKSGFIAWKTWSSIEIDEEAGFEI